MNGIIVVMIGWVAGVASTILTLCLKAHLESCKEERRARRETGRGTQDRRVETDRSTYRERLPVLIHRHLATYVRSGGRWWSNEEDLRNLIRSLECGAYEHFLDAAVETRWVHLVETTVELAKKRLASCITDADVQTYNAVRHAWEDAAKRSFGPLREIPGLCKARGGSGEADCCFIAAA